jgi:hypothetical protein
MKLYPFVSVIKEGESYQDAFFNWHHTGEYIIGYESESEIPKDSYKPNWIHPEVGGFEYEFYIGYSKIQIPFPSYKLRDDFINLMRTEYFKYHAANTYLLLGNLLPHLERYGVPSTDYTIRSNNPCGRRLNLNVKQISNNLIEWIDNTYYHFITIEQFAGIDFNKYFNGIDRDDLHFKQNIEYLARLIWMKPHSRKRESWREVSDIRKKHLYNKVEDLLRNNITEFVINHFEKYARNPNVEIFN